MPTRRATASVAGRRSTSSRRSSCWMRPPIRAAIRSEIRAARRRSCVTTASATSVSSIARRRSRDRASCAAPSRSSKGSSSSSTAGRSAKARASARRRSSPPESCLARRRASRSIPKRPSASATRSRRSDRDSFELKRAALTLCSTLPSNAIGRWNAIVTGPEAARRICPLSGRSRPATARNKVVLPAPFGPRIARASPAKSSRLATRSSKLPLRECRRTQRFRADRTGALIGVRPAGPRSAARPGAA